jgi:DNA-binding MarR family transcriptional regulator
MAARETTPNISAEFIAEECVAVRLRLLNRAVSRLYNKALRPYGLTISQMNILVAVSYLGEAKHRQVCHALSLDKSTLSRDVERMHSQGWLETLAGEDGRTSLLTVTSTGSKLLKRAIPAWRQAQRDAKRLLGESGVASLRKAATALRQDKSMEPG